MKANGKRGTGPTSVSLLSFPRRPSLTAAAARIASTKLVRSKASTAKWQEEAWALYSQVGELRYVSQTVGNAVGTAAFGVARTDSDGEQIRLDEEETPGATDRLAMDLVRGMLTERLATELAVGLFIAGEVLLVGAPDPDAPDSVLWSAHSPMELRAKGAVVELGDATYSVEDLTVIRIWRPHPAASLQADSPVRSSLPVLRELVALTMHISASVDSRLAGAGMLILPSSATVIGTAAPEDISDEDPILAALMDAMITPIRDRDSAAGVVPLVLTVPDDAGFQPHHLSFSTPLDDNAGALRDESIRRLALGLDVPPEVLLGSSGVNDWSQWAIQEETVRLHIAPLARLIARALTEEYLRPSLVALGVGAAEAARYGIAVDLAPLLSRPNRHAEAVALYDRGEIDGDTLREASGFDPSSAPESAQETVPAAVTRALDLVAASPALVLNPGLPELVRQIEQVLAGDIPGAAPVAEAPAEPATDSEPGPPRQGGPSAAR